MDSREDQQKAEQILDRLMEELEGEYIQEALANHWVGVPVESTEDLQEVLQVYTNDSHVSESDRALIRKALAEARGDAPQAEGSPSA